MNPRLTTVTERLGRERCWEENRKTVKKYAQTTKMNTHKQKQNRKTKLKNNDQKKTKTKPESSYAQLTANKHRAHKHTTQEIVDFSAKK